MKHLHAFFRRHLLRSKLHIFLLGSIASRPSLPSPSTPSSISTTASSPSLPDLRSCNQLLSSIGRTRGVDEARTLFDRMPQKDLVTYASMITLYLRDGCIPQAEALFLRAPHRNVVVESAMVDGYAKAGRLDEARKVFDAMAERNVVSWTSLLSGYCQAGRISEARRIFDEMPVRNVVSWTTMVLGYARSGLLTDARKLFDQMPERNVVAWTAMIKAYIENGRIDEARGLFDMMPDRNVYSWNVMISGYLDCDQVDEAIRLFHLMPHQNAVSWTTMAIGMARSGSAEQARALFEQMPVKDTTAWNAMITAYANEGLMSEARALFDSMPKRNVVTWNAMIDGCAKNGCQDEALSLFICMFRLSVKPNEATLTSILSNCDSNIEVRELHGVANKTGFSTRTSVTNALMKMYSSSGDLSSAWHAFGGLEAKDVISWTSMIHSFSNHGCGEHALQVFSQMLRHEVRPDGVTFLGVLSACSHSGLVDKGKKIFASMSSLYGLEPTAQHYSCLVDLLGRAGRIRDAKAAVEEMPASDRDGAVLGALLGACRLHDQMEEAYSVGEELIELDPSGSGGYVLLANMYASRGEWNDTARVRRMMRERRVKKVPGVSQIEVNTRNHVFYAGDQSHPQVKEIYVMLKEKLLPQMKDMGYLRVPGDCPRISCFVEPPVISDPT